MRHRILFFFLAFIGISQFVTSSDVRNKYNFNSDWLLYVGDVPEAKQPRFSDSEWKKVTLPHAFNEDEAFRLSIDELTDTIMWYRKHFRLPADSKNKKVFVEFEGDTESGILIRFILIFKALSGGCPLLGSPFFFFLDFP